MEWDQHVYATFNVTVVPPVLIVYTNPTIRQLTIPFKIEYNLTVEAAAPCRENTTVFIGLNYGEKYYIIYIYY